MILTLNWRRSLFVAALLGALFSSSIVRAQAKVGDDVKDFMFGDVIGGDGRGQLAAYAGQPVLLAWWQNISGGMDAARRAVDLGQKYEKNGLVVLLVTAQGFEGEGGRAGAAAFLAKTFPGHGARVVTNIAVPIVDTAAAAPPRIALIGVDGKLAVEGSNRTVGGKIEKALTAEFEKLKSGWGADATIKKARALAFGKRNFCEAYKVLQPANGMNGAAEHEKVQKELGATFDAWVTAVAKRLENGEFADAKVRLDELRVLARGMPEWEKTLEMVATAIEGPDAQKEAALEKKLTPLLVKVAAGKVDADTLKQLEKFAAENTTLRVARRAKAAAEIAAVIVKP